MKHSEAFNRLVSGIKPHISEISADNVMNKFKNKDSFALIDVREDHEWTEGFIEGAFHLGRGILERDIEKYFPDFETPLVLYCGGGYRSALSCDSLQRMGYKNVYSLAGGFKAWTQKALPICKKDC